MPDPRNRPQDGDGFGQGVVGVETDLDPLLQVLDPPVRNLPETGVDVFDFAGGHGLLVGRAVQRIALGRQRPETPKRLALQPTSGRNAMNRAISSASIRSVFAKAPRRLPNDWICAGRPDTRKRLTRCPKWDMEQPVSQRASAHEIAELSAHYLPRRKI